MMVKFVPREKLGKKAQKALDRRRRVTWDFSPVTKTVESRKVYSRKRKARNRDDYGSGFFHMLSAGSARAGEPPVRLRLERLRRHLHDLDLRAVRIMGPEHPASGAPVPDL